MNTAEKIVLWVAGALFFIAGTNGYAEESQLIFLVLAVTVNPFYVYYKIKHAKSSIEAEKPNLLEIRELQALKKRLYRLMIAAEVICVSFLLHLVFKDNYWLFLSGLGFVYFFISIVICSSSTCPRCKKFFFKEGETSSMEMIGPTSVGGMTTPLYVSLTNSCMHCGISWNQES